VASSTGNETCAYGFALTGSSQANAGSYASGTALIQRSTEANINGKPALVLWQGPNSPVFVELPLWVAVPVGSMYVVGMVNRVAGGSIRVFGVVEVVGVREP
jgi:hypothetical protein